VAQPVGILGGTFDPVHNAHLAVARAALHALSLERILWLPTGAPAYRPAPVAPAAHRLAMLRLAFGGEPRFAIDERELAPSASGYTYDTMKELAQEKPRAPLVLIMGADQYAKRDSWHRWGELQKLCRIAVVARPGAKPPDGDFTPIPMDSLDVSASEIRTRLARGADVAAPLPPPVLAYIRAHHLYGA